MTMTASSADAVAVPKDQRPGHPSFRRQRASRACETCHARKVRCDAASLGVPCTNCVAFSIECKIPTPKRKKTSGKKESDRCDRPVKREDGLGADVRARFSDGRTADDFDDISPIGRRESFPARPLALPRQPPRRDSEHDSLLNGAQSMADSDGSQAFSMSAAYSNIIKPKLAQAPIKEAGRVAYLGESSNLSLIVQNKYGSEDVVHYPLPENVRGARARISNLDSTEIDVLQQRGAFLLPPRLLCDELVDAYFKWVAPVVPVINRTKFMRQYRDTKHPPSLLLLQAILLAGSRVCNNPQLTDSTGSTTAAAMTFYKRAKALYDANYEDDRVTIVQALILMGWYWEGPEDVTKNVFYWSRVAVIVAQGSGMHRSVERSQLSRADKCLWKRIWWTLFTRDRSVAVALGRPVIINIEDADVEMVSAEDFIEDDDPDARAEFPPDPIHVHFFLQYVKLCEIMGLVLSQQYGVASKSRRNAIDLTHSDMALADWQANCPAEVRWDPTRHHFWSALLQANYYTTLCLLHRAHMPPAGSPESRVGNGYPEETAYPSRTIAYHAAGIITNIIEALQVHDQLRYTPAFIVYSLFSALIMHVYQMRSSNQSVVATTQHRLSTCMGALHDVSKVWLVAKMVHTLFESILGNKSLEERLQRAAGRRHNLKHHAHSSRTAKEQSPVRNDAPKRKYDEMVMGQLPASPMTFERSQPQSRSGTPGRTMPPSSSGLLPQISAGSPPLRHATDAFMGTSRTNTRPTTPFNGYPYPSTPPDLFLHTRNSPKISEDLWQNYDPAHLFPPEANGMLGNFPLLSPNDGIDPALRSPETTRPPASMAASSQIGDQQPMSAYTDPPDWAMHTGQQHSPDDMWSQSSSTGPFAPTNLNLGDWLEFFGLPGGDINSLNGKHGYREERVPTV
ncbi:hypothetical protein K470DRAFT_254163 [Piedraia hortae CBS 480.64]|uniref:Zn(2)-C6 fungal-type domain-containing protein n=1 Tax=Piedraia hortae CBS 480.64 TaxID=1314780 RepID=A0A6A7CAQ9_9PEZI|nr:hypothetical protein K470DRAFT_254163 [Piedraia hortae CBS 480.64]